MQRIAYEVVEGTLYRLSWPVLDGAPEDANLRVPLLALDESAEIPWEIAFLFPDPQGEPQRAETWPPTGGGGSIMPAAVEITLAVPRLGTVTRLLALPESP